MGNAIPLEPVSGLLTAGDIAPRERHVQIRTRERVRDLAEVYTHEREVNAMLDLVPDMFPSAEDTGNHDRTFLEPACGSGNFLEEILQRKLSTVTVRSYGRGERYEHRILRCLASTYGIDIDPENVTESRDRLRAVISSHLDRDLNTQAPTHGFATAVEAVLVTNIIRADTLLDSKHIVLVRYRPGRGATFTREWETLAEPEEAPQLDLFGEYSGASRRDSVGIHYSELALHPEPFVGGNVNESGK